MFLGAFTLQKKAQPMKANRNLRISDCSTRHNMTLSKNFRMKNSILFNILKESTSGMMCMKQITSLTS